jgi:nucleotide-binding universal stress UspA family protein
MYQHLLVPLDGSELSDRAISASLELARKLNASVTGFIAEPPAPTPGAGYGALSYVRAMEEHDEETAEHAKQVLQSFENRAAEAGVRFDGCYSRSQEVAMAILDAAEERGCDLIVMVTHGRGALGELLFGSATKAVLARSKLPLLVLH